MSVGYSSIELIGYLGSDPQSLQAAGGTNGARFSLAVNRTRTSDSGDRQQETDWYSVVAWERLGETCLSYLAKGSLVFVVGRPRIRRWEDDEGVGREQVQVLAEQVIFLDRPKPEEDKEE
jgi:single-strand DNA-binding protein